MDQQDLLISHLTESFTMSESMPEKSATQFNGLKQEDLDKLADWSTFGETYKMRMRRDLLQQLINEHTKRHTQPYMGSILQDAVKLWQFIEQGTYDKN